jgi:hypothetical protein
MKKSLCALMLMSVSVGANAQQTLSIPWQPATNDLARRAQVYHPNPILFVHGINAKDEDWGNDAIPALTSHFGVYDLPFAATDLADPGSTNNLARYRSKQRNFLHTFNYGDPPPSGLLDVGDFNRQSYEHIRWNAWDVDMRNSVFTNIFARTNSSARLTQPPNDERQTLDRRIFALREGYIADPDDPNAERPQIVLVSHSLGVLLSHYYLIRSAPDTGVRRFISIAGANQGSHFANWMMWYSHAHPAGRIFDGGRILLVVPQMARTAGSIPLPGPGPVKSPTAGYFKHARRGGIADAVVVHNQPDIPRRLRQRNPLMDFFWDNPAPRIEYVFNVYHKPPV